MSREFVPIEFPPHVVWRQRQGATIPERKDGRCRWCLSPVSGKRKSWCGEDCAKKFRRIFSWGDLRQYIIERDRVCQRCGSDFPGWKRGRSVTKNLYVWPFRKPDDPYAWTKDRGYYAQQCLLQEAWDVDHIVPVRKGGTDDPANLRLLCAKCHVAVGYEQRAAA